MIDFESGMLTRNVLVSSELGGCTDRLRPRGEAVKPGAGDEGFPFRSRDGGQDSGSVG